MFSGLITSDAGSASAATLGPREYAGVPTVS
jgi:hypothetical protein